MHQELILVESWIVGMAVKPGGFVCHFPILNAYETYSETVVSSSGKHRSRTEQEYEFLMSPFIKNKA